MKIIPRSNADLIPRHDEILRRIAEELDFLERLCAGISGDYDERLVGGEYVEEFARLSGSVMPQLKLLIDELTTLQSTVRGEKDSVDYQDAMLVARGALEREGLSGAAGEAKTNAWSRS